MIRYAVAAALAACTAVSGCAGTYDLFRGSHYTSTATDTTPTDHEVRHIEYELAPSADNRALALSCADRTRRVVRQSEVTKRYRYRGVGSKDAYVASAIADTVIAGVITGAVTALCLSDSHDVSCWHNLWASPYVLDLGYALVRAGQARSPVLVSRHRSADTLAFGDVPVQEQPTQCESVAEVRFGTLGGPTELNALRGYGSEDRRRLEGDSLLLTRDPQGALQVTRELVGRMLTDTSSGFAVIEQDGTVRDAVLTDRCKILRANTTLVANSAREALNNQCPVSTQTGGQ